MRIRESGMPEQDLWESFFDPEEILEQLGLTSKIKDVVEFGCGYGTFTLPAARRVSGTVYAVDLDPDMLSIVGQRAATERLDNIALVQRDFMANGTGLGDGVVDYAMVFNILHCEKPVSLLREAARNLGARATVGVIHWAHDRETPRGPPMAMRPSPDQCVSRARQAGLEPSGPVIELPPHHFGLRFVCA